MQEGSARAMEKESQAIDKAMEQADTGGPQAPWLVVCLHKCREMILARLLELLEPRTRLLR
jgi:hypothetical protein